MHWLLLSSDQTSAKYTVQKISPGKKHCLDKMQFQQQKKLVEKVVVISVSTSQAGEAEAAEFKILKSKT